MRSANAIIPALWFLMLVNYMDRVTISFAGPAIMKSLSMTPASFGIVLSSFAVGFLLAQIPGGLLTDRWGARPLLIIGPILWAIFTGITGFAIAFAGFVAVRLCFGLSEGISNTAFWKIIGDNFDSKRRSRALGICLTPIALAPALAGPLVGKLVAVYGWQVMFMVMSVPAMLVSLVNYLTLPQQRTSRALPPAGPRAASLRTVLGYKSLWLQSTLQFGMNIASWGYLGWMPSYLALERHINLKSLGILAGIPYVFGFIGLLLGGGLASTVLHRYRPQLAIAAYVLAGLSLTLVFQAQTTFLAIAALSSAGLFLFGALSPTGAIALDLAPPQHRAVYVGVFTTSGQVGAILAPAVIGLLVSRTGTFVSGFSFMIAALGLAAACMLALMPFLSPSATIAHAVDA